MFVFHPAKYWLHGMLFALLTIFCTMSACSGTKKISTVVTNYPSFWKELGGVESISLAPMENTTYRMGDEVGVRADILQRLKTNEWPKVYDRQTHLWGDEHDMLAQERQFERGSGTRLILFTTLNDYRTEEYSETRYQSIPLYSYYYEYEYDDDGNEYEIERSYISGYHEKPYTWTRNEAFVAISVRLIDIDTGKLILTQNFKGDWWSTGSPPNLSLSTCLSKARDEAISALITAVRVTSRTITLRKDDLRTADDLDKTKNEWIYSNSFSIQQEEFRAVVRLPSSANLNKFIVDVVVKDQEEAVVSKEFAWDGAYGTSGYVFSPKEIATRGAGLRTYTLRLIQKDGMKILLTHDFKITK